MVTDFKIHAVFHENLGSRCSHNHLNYDPRNQVNYDGVKDMSDHLIPLLKQLKSGALRNFWYISP